MEEKNISFYEIPVFSFIPPKYAKLSKEKGGKIFGAFLIVFLILSLVTCIKFSKGFDEVTESLKDECPEFTLIDGEFEIDQPYSFDNDGVYVEINDSLEEVDEDTIRKINSDYSYQSVMVVGKYDFAMLNNGQIQAFSYKDLGNFTISKDKLVREIMPSLKSIIIIVIMVWSIVSLGLFYLVACIMQLFTMMFGKIFNKDFDADQRYRITVLAKFPVHVVIFIISQFLNVNFWVNLILQIAFIAICVFFYENENTQENVLTIEQTDDIV